MTHPLTPTPDAAFRAQPPPPLSTARHWSPPQIFASQLDNGLRVLIVPRPGASIVTVVYVNPQAQLQTPLRSRGLASLTGDALLQGFRWESGEVAEGVRVDGRAPFAYTDRHGTFIGLTALSESFEPALQVISRMVQAPLLSDLGFATAVSLQREAVHDESRTISAFLRPMEAELAFGEGHRWAFDHRDWARDLAETRVEHVRDFHAQAYQPHASTLVIVGGVDAIFAESVTREALGGWQNAGPAPPRPTVMPRTTDPLAYFVHTNGRGAELRMLLPLSIRPQERAGLMLLAKLLAGSSTGGLWGSLRHQRGLTYGIRGDLMDYGTGGYLRLSTEVDSYRVGDVVDEMLAQVRGAAERVCTAGELEIAKAQVLTELVPWSNRALALRLATLESQGLHAESLGALVSQVRSATPEELRRLALRLLSPEAASLLIVGAVDKLPNTVSNGRAIRRFAVRDMDH